MNWKRYFSPAALKKGQEFYKQGRLRNYAATENDVHARVSEARVYTVNIQGLLTGSCKFTCQCPEARSGKLCSHMAAALYRHDEDYTPVEFLPSRKTLFDLTIDRSNLFYDLPSIFEKLQTSREVIYRAMKLVKDGSVILSASPRMIFPSFEEPYSITEGLFIDKGRERHLAIGFSQSRPRLCTCEACDTRKDLSFQTLTACEHEAAMLLLIDAYLLRFNPGDITNAAGEQFFSAILHPAPSNSSNENIQRPVLSLQPRLEGSPSNLKLAFRAGKNRLYLIRNLAEFIDAARALQRFPITKHERLDFASEAFDENSLHWYSLISDAVDIDDQLKRMIAEQRRSVSASAESRLHQSIPLSGLMLDRFYDAALDTHIPLASTIGWGSSELMIHPSDPPVFLKISRVHAKNPSEEGLEITGSAPVLLHGAKYNYFIYQQTLSRLDLPADSPLSILMNHTDPSGHIRIRIGRRKIRQLLDLLIPALEAFPAVELDTSELEGLADALDPVSKFTFYLDVSSKYLLCRGEVRYDETTLPLEDPLNWPVTVPAFRDALTELTALDAIRSAFPVYRDDLRSYVTPRDNDLIYHILKDGIPELSTLGTVQISEDFQRLKLRRLPRLTVNISLDSGLLNVELSSKDFTAEELLEILAGYRSKKRYHRLKNGDFISLEDDETLETLAEMVYDSGLSVKEFTQGKLHLPLYRALYLNSLLENHEDLAASRDESFIKLLKNFGSAKNTPLFLPDSISTVMREYQKEGSAWMQMLSSYGFSGILADDMGLGKTIQMISVLLNDKHRCPEGEKRLSLITCPSSLVFNWKEEFDRFAPSLHVVTVTGTAPVRQELLSSTEDVDVLITSYDLLKRDISLYETLRFSYHVLDEAQYIKNHQSAAAKSVKVIQSMHRMALTGTPIENRLSELWSIFDFLMPGFLFSYSDFRLHYEVPITKDQDDEATERLKNMVRPFILRRLKTDVLNDLPEKLEEVRYARFEAEQQTIYDAQVAALLNLLDDPETSRFSVLAQLTKLRQICCDPSLIIDEYQGASAKLDACMELVESAIDSGHRMLLFSQFTSMLAILENELKNRHIPFYTITGTTAKEQRVALVHDFNGGTVPVFLISLKAGGTGLNLTGADMVIHYDPWWNLAAQNQATDRAHRIGQTKTVSVFRLIAKNSIEEKILQLQERKKDLADAILSGEAESLTNLSRDELIHLLRG